MVSHEQMRNSATVARRIMSIVAAGTMGLALIAPVAGQDRMVLGPDQFKGDMSGAGAVLCTWSRYLSIQTWTANCALPRRPVDDAIDQAVVDIDEFILANSSLHPTRPMLENFKHDAAARDAGPQYCENKDLPKFRNLLTPEKVQSSVKTLLAVPREPLMNPCLWGVGLIADQSEGPPASRRGPLHLRSNVAGLADLHRYRDFYPKQRLKMRDWPPVNPHELRISKTKC
jgi:hypothetical protein